ncbi:MAG TPA: hypothetical protein VMY87_09510 [Armatimonadota bacterium]|nr:hypothetical protein [Armatimonadota bacterium]
MRQEADTTFVGWHGISARVPAEWTLAAVGGDRRSGYIRVDHERMPRLQVKWSRKHIDLEQKREEYIKRLTVGKRRRATGLEVTTDVKVLSKRSKPKKELVTFAWRGSHCGMGAIWNCEVCGRALIAQVGWPIEEEGREVAQEVLESLDDHGIGGWDTWGVDGLVFLAPTDFELQGWKRMTRYLDLKLVRNQEKLMVARWGMVPLVLGDRSVQAWFEEENRRRRDVAWQVGEATIRGHEGVRAWGERRRIAGSLRTGLARALKRSPVVQFEARAWHCPESNRLYLVESLHDGKGGALQGAVESILCHEES